MSQPKAVQDVQLVQDDLIQQPQARPSQTGGLLKAVTRPDQSIELQYFHSSVPVAVMVWNGRGTMAVAEMIVQAVNDHAARLGVTKLGVAPTQATDICEGRTIWNSDGTEGPCLICPP
jgi:hypothetical protein